MLASIFSKVTTSLGKSYVYAGLLPSGFFLLYFLFYFTSGSEVSVAAQSLLTKTDGWSFVALLGAVWIALAFLLYAIRAPIFGLFNRIPGGPIGRRLVFRRVKKRLTAARALAEVEWRATALFWLTRLGLQRGQIGDLAHWIIRPAPELGLQRSRLGREALTRIDLTVGDAANLDVCSCDRIVDGIFALYLVAGRTHDLGTEHEIEGEIRGWRSASGSRQAAEILEQVDQEIKRQFTRAFMACRRFGEGAYIFPTELGNRIAALDDYALERYGINTAMIWDRLWWVLPADAKSEVSDARLALESLINLALTILLGGVLLPIAEVAHCGTSFGATGLSCNGFRLGGFVIVALFLSVLVYRGGAFAMEVFAVKSTSLIDMYRLSMVRQLGFQVNTVDEELRLYAELKGLFVQGSKLTPTRPIIVPEKSESKPEDKTGKSGESVKAESLKDTPAGEVAADDERAQSA